MKIASRKGKNLQISNVIMFVDYRVAPEFSFQFAIIDGQSATSFLAERVLRVPSM